MSKILITGATDGIGLVTAQALAKSGHSLLLHGRSEDKLSKAAKAVLAVPGAGEVETYRADFSHLDQVHAMAERVRAEHSGLDVLINNAGVLRTSNPLTPSGMDVRFVVNTLAPYLLTQELLPLLGEEARVVNLSSAAQAPVRLAALKGGTQLEAMAAYSQSKLAITMWTRHMAAKHPRGPLFFAVNPGSLLASKMVKEGFGVAGNDLSIGADILVRASLSDEFEGRSGEYYDNDSKRFAPPHPAGLDDESLRDLMLELEQLTGAQ